MTTRIDRRMAKLKSEGRPALVTYFMGGDPNYETSLKIMKALKLETTLEDMLLTLGDQIHLIKLVSPTSFFYLVADRAQANLAIVRNGVNKHTKSLA